MPKEIEIEIKKLTDRIIELEKQNKKKNRWLIFTIRDLCKQAKKQNPDFDFKLEITCDGCKQRHSNWKEVDGKFYC